MRINKGTCLILFAMIISVNSYAQDEIDQILEAGTDDASKYVESYIEPFFKGFGFGMTNGWYNTAKPHKLLGFDLTITGNVAFVPDKDLVFTFRNSDYNTIRLDNGSTSTELPTIFGTETITLLEILDENGNPIPPSGVSIEALDGLDLKDEIGTNAVPVPMAQLGIGIPKGTDLKLRYTPSLDFDDVKVKLLGIGIMHDVKQWIPGIKLLPFDLSVLIAFTDLETSYDFTDSEFNTGSNDQVGVFDVNAWTYQILASKKIAVLTIYGGLGYNAVKSDFRLNGTFDIGGRKTLTDPLNLNFKSSGVRATAGFRVKLAIVTLHADYTLQEYKTLTVGFGFNVR
ncbi:hypothetical protein QQ008_18430 [Fulvivirgaceae bacterium BMA10]|uniref:Outer membrane protein beta-barrel domain-containing protein n=1 Tax=Splendidivirga corallicola TaxID=3051826 RepID=A0ABT8KV79_9BACT|nr:hypothetical protein [Fulvivirgaceae bacterium BMA10]